MATLVEKVLVSAIEKTRALPNPALRDSVLVHSDKVEARIRNLNITHTIDEDRDWLGVFNIKNSRACPVELLQLSEYADSSRLIGELSIC